jgi:hypothetical protein
MLPFVLPLEKLVGGGCAEKGALQLEALPKLLHLIPFALRIQTVDQFEQSNDPRRLLIFILGLCLLVFEKKIEDWAALFSSNKAETSLMGPDDTGRCWSRAFGSMITIALPHLSGFSDGAVPPGSFLSIPPNASLPDKKTPRTNTTASNLVHCRLGDLFTAIGAQEITSLNQVVIIKGLFCMAVRIGELSGRKLWHICSLDEAALVIEEPEHFVNYISQRISSPDHPQKQNIELDTIPDMDMDEVVLLGALFDPSATVFTFGAMEDLPPARLERLRRVDEDKMAISRLHMDRFSFHVELGMGAQGPQGTFGIGFEAARHDNNSKIGRVGCTGVNSSFSISQALVIFTEARRSQVLVFDTQNKVLVEQNLFNVVVLHFISTGFGSECCATTTFG